MHDATVSAFFSSSHALAVVLGTNEIASAIAVWLNREGFSVVLSHDPFPPVIRRMMAFHDALFGDLAVVEGVDGKRAETVMEIAAAVSQPQSVAVTPLELSDLLAIRMPDVLVDARMQKHRVTPDFRGLAKVSVGVGPNFAVAENCDVAVETRPTKPGLVVTSGATDAPDGATPLLGGVGRERFVYSARLGLWHTPIEIGMRVFKDFVLGYHEGAPVRAPIDGIVRGIARDSTRVPAGVKLVEIDPRGRRAVWTGSDARGRTIAHATLAAIQAIRAEPSRGLSKANVRDPVA